MTNPPYRFVIFPAPGYADQSYWWCELWIDGVDYPAVTMEEATKEDALRAAWDWLASEQLKYLTVRDADG